MGALIYFKKEIFDMTHEEFEKKVIDLLLSGDSADLECLRKQYENSIVEERDFNGWGFYTYFDVPDNLRVDYLEGRVDDVVARFGSIEEFINDDQYHFILCVENGKISYLEGFPLLYPWDETKYDEARVEYAYPDRRDYELKRIH